jgi:hypothetical protein
MSITPEGGWGFDTQQVPQQKRDVNERDQDVHQVEGPLILKKITNSLLVALMLWTLLSIVGAMRACGGYPDPGGNLFAVFWFDVLRACFEGVIFWALAGIPLLALYFFFYVLCRASGRNPSKGELFED